MINNAGILRDKSFLKMEPENWQAVLVSISPKRSITARVVELRNSGLIRFGQHGQQAIKRKQS